MTRLAANLKWLFTEWPFERRFEIAARAGFRGIEFSLPYEHPPHELRARCDANGLQYVYLISPCGDWEGGERGLACLPDRIDEFRDGFARALDYASTLGCSLIHLSAGNRLHHPAARREATYAANLAWAADRARGHGVRVAIEPICRASYPDFHLRTIDEAGAVIAMLARDNLGIVFDFHHVQRESGDLMGSIERHRDLIFHYQLANPPGRNEPGVGEVDLPWCIDRAQQGGYAGWFSCEYRPARSSAASLRWAAPYGIDASRIEEHPHAEV